MSATTGSSRGSPRALRLALVALAAAGFPLGVAIVVVTWWNGWSWLGAALMSLSPMVAAMLAARLFKPAAMRPAMRRYGRRLALNMIVYVAVLMGATMLYQRGLTEGPLGYLIALAPALPIIGVFVIIARFLAEETDEFMRKIVLSSLVWSGALTLCEATVWGFLETFGKAPHVWMWAVPVAFFAQLGVTMPLAGRKYR